ncbi:MAG: hypothetical protein WCC21_20810 [Candidatus Acidiferrales bacterium]
MDESLPFVARRQGDRASTLGVGNRIVVAAIVVLCVYNLPGTF